MKSKERISDCVNTKSLSQVDLTLRGMSEGMVAGGC